MSALHLAKPADLERLSALVKGFDEETEQPRDQDQRRAALMPLLDGVPHGAIYLIGPARAPMGYVVVSFGWSLELGGMDGRIDQIYLRRAVRRRGIATEVLTTLPTALANAGVKALHLKVDRDNEAAMRLAAKAKFMSRDDIAFMSKFL
ncbi:GNAT family N-acetyltransferase [Pontibaca salina]|uniref:GNAT family N-acetyltransferase n=1 Tax=Pontibaca salina TaxID=2795731 RepID=A0A934HKJ4_9RHOB|nr:GNAT family N-acetyltransferase [Pontibaca salina]MBI6629793.1 GNAT family N-acetyltransferase [Pontibaca salina]